MADNVATFSPIEPEDLIISNDNITSTVWENNQPTLTGYFTS